MLDNNEFTEAKEELLLLATMQSVEQLRRDYRIRYQESRAQWGLHVGMQAQGQQVLDGNLIEERGVVSKGLGDSKKFGGVLERKHSGNKSADLTHVYLTYERNFFWGAREFEIDFKIGDDLRLKKEGTPLFLSLRPMLSNKGYMNATAWVTAPEALSVAQWQTPRAYSSGVSFYSDVEKKWKSMVYDQRIGGEWRSLDYSGDRGKQSKADLVLLFHLPGPAWFSLISFGPGLSYARMTSQSTLLRSVYVNDSLHYFVAGELQTQLGNKSQDEIKAGARVGGDPRRDLAFADSWSSWVEYIHPLGRGEGVRAHVEYSTEVPQNYKGEQFSFMIMLDLLPNGGADL